MDIASSTPNDDNSATTTASSTPEVPPPANDFLFGIRHTRSERQHPCHSPPGYRHRVEFRGSAGVSLSDISGFNDHALRLLP